MMTMTDTTLNSILERFIKPDYHAAVRLIIIDHLYDRNTKIFGQTARTVQDLLCQQVLNMVNEKPHTMEYVDWDKMHSSATYIVKSYIINGFSRYNSAMQQEYLLQLQQHLRDNYPSVCYQNFI